MPRPGLGRRWGPIAFLTFFLTVFMGAASAQGSLLDAARSPVGPATGSRLASLTASPAVAIPAAPLARVDALEIEWVADRLSAAPGESIWLALRLKHDPHWHTYWQNPGDSGLPTTIEAAGPPGVQFGALQWPVPTRLWVGPLANYGYEGEVYLPFRLTVPVQERPEPGVLPLSARVSWLICREVCIPGEAQLRFDLPVRAIGQAPTDSAHAGPIRQALQQVPDPQRALQARWVRHEAGLALLVSPSQHSAGSVSQAGSASQSGSASQAGSPPAGVAPRAVEFFAQQPGWLSVPAPQQLLHHQDGGWRLELTLIDGAQVADQQPIEGALRIGSEVAWISAVRAEGPLPPAQRVSVAQRPASAPSAGTLDAGGWAFALILAALGGLILNLMPCVFPVVGLKIASLAGGDPDSPEGRRALRGGLWAFVLGILVCFAALAGLMLGLRAAGAAIGWGFQLQSPGFVAAMALLFVAVGLNFSGVYEIGMSLTRLGQLELKATPQGVSSGLRHYLGAFLSGVLAVLVATPCTAPFMGSAVGLTLTMPAWAAMTVFLAVGVGMATPYLLLGLRPQALARLPRPGVWMQTLRSVLAFPMYASAAWLVWVLAQQTEPDAVLRVLLAAVSVALAGWAWSRRAFSRSAGLRSVWSLVGLAAMALAAALWAGIDSAPSAGIAQTTEASGSVAPGAAAAREGGSAQEGRAAGQRAGIQASAAGGPASASAQGAWAPWSTQAVNDALAAGRPVLVDFTAAWCVSCQANKKLVLETSRVKQAFAAQNVALLRADWTRQDPLITAELARHGRNGVPLYLVYRPGQTQPTILPELLTTAIVIESLKP